MSATFKLKPCSLKQESIQFSAGGFYTVSNSGLIILPIMYSTLDWNSEFTRPSSFSFFG